MLTEFQVLLKCKQTINKPRNNKIFQKKILLTQINSAFGKPDYHNTISFTNHYNTINKKIVNSSFGTKNFVAETRNLLRGWHPTDMAYL